MNVDELRKLTTNGFRPFKLNLSDGRSFSVRHPEFIAFSDLVVVVFGADRSRGNCSWGGLGRSPANRGNADADATGQRGDIGIHGSVYGNVARRRRR